MREARKRESKTSRRIKRPESPYKALERQEARTARNRIFVMSVFVLITIVLTLFMIRLILKSTSADVQILIVREGTISNEIYEKTLIVRDETPLAAPVSGVFSPSANDGDKLAKGADLGVLIDVDGIDEWAQIQDINQKISSRQLALIAEGSLELAHKDFLQADKQILPIIHQVRSLDFDNVAESKQLSSQLQVIIQERNEKIMPDSSDDPEIQQLLEAKKSAEEALKQYSTKFNSPESGIISYVPDMYCGKYNLKSVLSLDLDTVEKLIEDFSVQKKSPNRTMRAGEEAAFLVKNMEQTFSFVVENMSAVDFRLDKTYVIDFYENAVTITDAKLLQAKEEGNKLHLVFRTEQELENLIQDRVLAAKIILESDRGLKVPLESLRFPDENHDTFATVMMVISGYIFEEPVEILKRDGDYAIVSPAVGAENEIKLGSVIVQNPQAVEAGDAFVN